MESTRGGLPVSLGVTASIGITLWGWLVSSLSSAFFQLLVIECPHHTHTAAHSSSADKPAKDWTDDDSQIPSSDETNTLDIGFKRIQRDSLLFHAVSGVSASREANPAPHPSKEFA